MTCDMVVCTIFATQVAQENATCNRAFKDRQMLSICRLDNKKLILSLVEYNIVKAKFLE